MAALPLVSMWTPRFRCSILATVAALLLAGCVSKSGIVTFKPKHEDPLKECVSERHKIIIEAWSEYEKDTWKKVVYPDWRIESARWARAECKYGKAIRQFYP